MKTIRSNVFETNSSSTHSIAIPKNCSEINNISFYIGEYGKHIGFTSKEECQKYCDWLNKRKNKEN